MTHRYSLSDYIVSVQVPAQLISSFLSNEAAINTSTNTISIGGESSYLGTITLATPNAQFTTEGDVTGGWVHNQSLNKTGTLSVSIRQVNDTVRLLARLYQTYYSTGTEVEGLTITLSKATQDGPVEIANCKDCYLANRPNLVYGDTAAMQDWEFTCGEINVTGNLAI